MAKAYFQAYHSILEAMEQLDDAERGRLFTALLIYSETGEAPELPGNEKFVFPALRGQIDRDADAYAEKCRKLSTNSKQRKAAAEDHESSNTANDSKCNQMASNDINCNQLISNDIKCSQGKGEGKGEGKGKGKGEGKGGTPPIPPPNGFVDFWAAYPRKQAKMDAIKAWKKLAPSPDLVARIVASVQRSCDSPDWRKDGGQYIPYPATYLNGRRWEDEQSTGGRFANLEYLMRTMEDK